MSERMRVMTHYMIMTTVTAEKPTPMVRFEVAEVDEHGELTGKTINESIVQRYPKARKSVDGSLTIVGIELDDLFGAVDEFRAGYKPEDKFQILSPKEAWLLMKTAEWQADEEEGK